MYSITRPEILDGQAGMILLFFSTLLPKAMEVKSQLKVNRDITKDEINLIDFV